MLLRKYVSRTAARNGRAVLEAVGFTAEEIEVCFSSSPLIEEAVQAGLARWCDNQGTQPPTWGVLIDAMEFAGFEQQYIQSLKKSLDLYGTLLHWCVCVWRGVCYSASHLSDCCTYLHILCKVAIRKESPFSLDIKQQLACHPASDSIHAVL